MGKLTQKIRPTERNLGEIPNQSGVYILHRGQQGKYVGSAAVGRLQQRIKQQLNEKRGITSIQYRPTSSEREVRSLEKKYRDRLNPEQKKV
jgi:excinuclease UvrABC nuclease subunit